jgi:hypothetical protein
VFGGRLELCPGGRPRACVPARRSPERNSITGRRARGSVGNSEAVGKEGSDAEGSSAGPDVGGVGRHSG